MTEQGTEALSLSRISLWLSDFLFPFLHPQIPWLFFLTTLWSLLSILNFVQIRHFSPLFFCSAVNSAVSQRMHRNIRLCPIWTKAIFELFMPAQHCLQVGHCWLHGGCHQGAQSHHFPPHALLFFLRHALMPASLGWAGALLWEAIWCRQGFTVSLSPAPGPQQAAVPCSPHRQHSPWLSRAAQR